MTSSLEPEQLLRETTWVRRLAASLVADRDLADDIAQDAMVAAWQGAPPGEERRPWLVSVVKRLAARVHRATQRRAQRERRVARPEALPSTADLVARAQLQRHVVAIVLSLGEPYRGTLLLRFVHGADYAAIATQQGVAIETVRSRIKRGLGLVRVQLDDGHGGRSAWAMPLLGVQFPMKVTGVSVSGVMVMSMSKNVMAALVAVLIGVATWLGLRGESATDVRPAAGEPAAAALTAPAEAAATQLAVDAPPAPAAVRAPIPDGRSLTIVGRVVSQETLAPLAAARAVLQSFGSGDEGIAGITDQAGFFRFVVTTEQRQQAHYLMVSATDHATRFEAIERTVRTREQGDLDVGDIVLPVGARLSGRVIDVEQRAVDGATLFLAQGERLDRARSVGRSGLNGAFVLDERVAPSDFNYDNDLGKRAFLIAIAATGIGWVELDPTQGRSEQSGVVVGLRPSAEVIATVRDANGQLLAGVEVAVVPLFAPLSSERSQSFTGDVRAHFTATTDATGVARISGLPVSTPELVRIAHHGHLGGAQYQITACVAEHALWTTKSQQLTVGPNTLDISLAAAVPPVAVALTGCVRDSEGKPIAGATVSGLGHRTGATTAADGTFAYRIEPTARPGTVAMAVHAAGHAAQVTNLTLAADTTALVHDFTLARGVDVAGRVVDQTARPVPGCSLWVEDESGQNLLHFGAQTDAEGRFVLPGMPLQKLAVRVSAPSVAEGAWSAEETIAVDAKAASAVTITLTWTAFPTTRVQIDVLDGADGSAVDVADVQSQALDADNKRRYSPAIDRRPGGVILSRLSPGRWRVRIAAQGNRRGTCEFDLPTPSSELRMRCTVAAPGSILGTLAFDSDVPVDHRNVGAVWTLPFDAGRYTPRPGQQAVHGTRGYIPVSALAGGPFLLDDIEPGTEVTLWVNNDFVWARAAVKVPAATEVPFDLRLHYGGALRLVCAAGTPRDHLAIHLDPIGHGASAFEAFGSDGYEIALAPGRWRWRATWKDGADGSVGEVEVVRGVCVDLTLSR